MISSAFTVVCVVYKGCRLAGAAADLYEATKRKEPLTTMGKINLATKTIFCTLQVMELGTYSPSLTGWCCPCDSEEMERIGKRLTVSSSVADVVQTITEQLLKNSSGLTDWSEVPAIIGFRIADVVNRCNPTNEAVKDLLVKIGVGAELASVGMELHATNWKELANFPGISTVISYFKKPSNNQEGKQTIPIVLFFAAAEGIKNLEDLDKAQIALYPKPFHISRSL